MLNYLTEESARREIKTSKILLSILCAIFFIFISAPVTANTSQENPIKELENWIVKTENGIEKFVVIAELEALYASDQEFNTLINKALSDAVTPPGGCTKQADLGPMKDLFELNAENEFCWHGRPFSDLVKLFDSWLDSLVYPTEPYTGFEYYTMLYNLAYENSSAIQFLETNPGLEWTRNFTKTRGHFMNSTLSMNAEVMAAWKKALGPEMNDYIIPPGGYKTFNEFFYRKVKPSARPIASAKNDAILVAPADSSVNIINSNLKATTQLNTKYAENLNVRELLAGSTHADAFNGGTAMSFVLMPNVYHRYHSPVAGTVIESKDVNGAYFGMAGNFYSFINNGNVGGYMAKYGVFGTYHRGYYIIQTEKYGKVAMIPIGLDDISSVNFTPKFDDIPNSNKSAKVKKGEEVGYFAYGGSTIILLFEPGVIQNVSVEQGMQVGELAPVSN